MDEIKTTYVCERCGKLVTKKFGSGRFCSRACANARTHSKETKDKIKTSLVGREPSNKGFYKGTNIKLPEKFCKVCGKQLKSYNKTGFCQYCMNNTDIGRAARVEAGRKGYETMLARGTHKGWQSRNIISYAEQFWIKVLDSNCIPYEREYLVKYDSTHYFLDFLITLDNSILIDLEIDGKQHTYEDRVLSDNLRDANLKSLGYIVYRIPWNEVNSNSGKDLMQQKINDFLNFYNSFNILP